MKVNSDISHPEKKRFLSAAATSDEFCLAKEQHEALFRQCQRYQFPRTSKEVRSTVKISNISQGLRLSRKVYKEDDKYSAFYLTLKPLNKILSSR